MMAGLNLNKVAAVLPRVAVRNTGVRRLGLTRIEETSACYAATDETRNDVLDHIQAHGRSGKAIVHLTKSGRVDRIEFVERRLIRADEPTEAVTA
jgi:hypothetical protein